jgi:Zn-dependent membrane protease YugP
MGAFLSAAVAAAGQARRITEAAAFEAERATVLKVAFCQLKTACAAQGRSAPNGWDRYCSGCRSPISPNRRFQHFPTAYWIILIAVRSCSSVCAESGFQRLSEKLQSARSRSDHCREAAEAVISSAGIRVGDRGGRGMMTDHYDPVTSGWRSPRTTTTGTAWRRWVVAATRRSRDSAQGGYAMMKVRQSIAPTVAIRRAGRVLHIWLGGFFPRHFLFGPSSPSLRRDDRDVLFQLVTLPVEFDASRRAKLQMVNSNSLAARDGRC